MWYLLLIIIPILLILYNRWAWIHSYWHFKHIPGPEPLPFIGNMLQIFLGRKTVGDLCLEWYREYPGIPLVGFYNMMQPHLLIRRLDYVQSILVKEFALFSDRIPPRPKKINLSDEFLSVAAGNKWKVMRTKSTPIFTTDKLKGMMEPMSKCIDKIIDKIDRSGSADIEHTRLIHSYIIDSTANTVFGIESDDLLNPSSDFHKNCKSLFNSTPKTFIYNLLYFAFPKLSSFLNVPMVPTELTTYFQRLIEETSSRRKSLGVRKNDILQLLIDLKDKGQVDVHTWDEADNHLKFAEPYRTSEQIEITNEFLTSQAMEFLTTGFDTMTTTLTFTLLELTQNERAMEKLVQELDRVMEQHKEFTYEALTDMKYLEMCLMESMRLHPSIQALTRYCVRNYTFDNGTQVEKGTTVLIPVQAIHLDPNIYTDPNVFNPERFSTPPQPGSYLPFGDGPRICIAKRFSMLQMKMMLARLLHRYNVHMSHRTQLPVQTSKTHVPLKITSPVYFNLRKRSH